ncbi:Ammonia transporter [Raoultella terrigena]|uniref:Ammonia transporter n=1 Tax=Raoultella terrigena TaxID=577 RepID=A0A3P8J4Y1_RAOTE|nr:Ammonia transporter [Raoultella terrigena]
MKIATTMKTGLGALALLPGLAMAAPAVADKADNAFMMICTALVLFMTIPGIALFYGGLIRGKNVLSMLTQVIVTFGSGVRSVGGLRLHAGVRHRRQLLRQL